MKSSQFFPNAPTKLLSTAAGRRIGVRSCEPTPRGSTLIGQAVTHDHRMPFRQPQILHNLLGGISGGITQDDELNF